MSGGRKPGVHVVVLNWNGWRDTVDCLESLEKLTYPRSAVTVVDNGSSDDSVAQLRARFPALDLIESGTNLGFSEGNNFGIRRALQCGADYVWVLNNDTTVAPDCVDRLVQASEADPAIAVAGPRIFFACPPDRVWFSGAVFRPWFGQSIMAGFGRPASGGEASVTDAAYVPGCAMFVRSQALVDVGLLDPDFFFIGEDLDYGLRVRRRGLKCVVVPSARIWHKVSASAGGMQSPLVMYYATRNRLLVMRKHGRWYHWPTFLLHFTASYPLKFLTLALMGRRRMACVSAIVRGSLDFARGRCGMAPARTSAWFTRRLRA